MRVLQGYHTAFSDPTLNSRGSRFMDLGSGADRRLDALKIMQCPCARLPLAKKEINTYIHTYIHKENLTWQSINQLKKSSHIICQSINSKSGNDNNQIKRKILHACRIYQVL